MDERREREGRGESGHAQRRARGVSHPPALSQPLPLSLPRLSPRPSPSLVSAFRTHLLGAGPVAVRGGGAPPPVRQVSKRERESEKKGKEEEEGGGPFPSLSIQSHRLPSHAPTPPLLSHPAPVLPIFPPHPTPSPHPQARLPVRPPPARRRRPRHRPRAPGVQRECHAGPGPADADGGRGAGVLRRGVHGGRPALQLRACAGAVGRGGGRGRAPADRPGRVEGIHFPARPGGRPGERRRPGRAVGLRLRQAGRPGGGGDAASHGRGGVAGAGVEVQAQRGLPGRGGDGRRAGVAPGGHPARVGGGAGDDEGLPERHAGRQAGPERPGGGEEKERGERGESEHGKKRRGEVGGARARARPFPISSPPSHPISLFSSPPLSPSSRTSPSTPASTWAASTPNASPPLSPPTASSS